MRMFSQKLQKLQRLQRNRSVTSARPRHTLSEHRGGGHSILQLHRTIGNRAVQRLLQAETDHPQRNFTSDAPVGVAAPSDDAKQSAKGKGGEVVIATTAPKVWIATVAKASLAAALLLILLSPAALAAVSLVGTNGVDDLEGTNGAEKISARAGGDRVFGGGGADTINGGTVY